MEREILTYIIAEAEKHAEKFQMYHNYQHLSQKRNERRIMDPSPKEIKLPSQWAEDKKFNPFYVIKHGKQIANSISKKLRNGTYKPEKPFIKQIPKKSGGTRTISIFQIPDAAVSHRLYDNLLSKNKHRFSALSYAYRNDRNVHYAIQDIAYELKHNPRLFIAEFDFKDFFGSINHDFLKKQLDQNSFLISPSEKKIIYAFVDMQTTGIPLGTSISLFIANLICWKLDRKLEDAGLRFARYADDTIIWSNDYSKICKSFEIINDFSTEAGVKINEKKSEGISLLSKPGMPSEFGKTKEYVEFLGYRLSVEKVGIKDRKVTRIKKQISYLLYRNLLHPVKTKPYKAVTIPNNDEDEAFVTAIMQIRRYMYGNLTDYKIRKFLKGQYKKLSFKGIMSFYPLIDDIEQLKELDRWLISTILNCLRYRCKLLKEPYRNLENNFPFNMTANTILPNCKSRVIKGKQGLIEIPSFLRIYEAIKRGVVDNGIEYTMHKDSIYYDYDD